jgi:hypothetical protein
MARRRSTKYRPLDFLEFLLSPIFARDPLTAEHRADLYQSGLTDETIERQRFRSVPPDMWPRLLGHWPSSRVISGYVLPYHDPIAGGWWPHIRTKIFPTLTSKTGKKTTKYLQQGKRWQRWGYHPARLYFPILAAEKVLHSMADLYVTEGEKKATALAQTGVPVIAIAGVEMWHHAKSDRLLPDFDLIPLADRVVHLWPDGDVDTNEQIYFAMDRLGLALKARGVRAMTIVRPESPR